MDAARLRGHVRRHERGGRRGCAWAPRLATLLAERGRRGEGLTRQDRRGQRPHAGRARDLHVVRTFDFRLVRDDRDWLIDEAAERPSDVAPGTAVVPVELREYDIRLSAGRVAGSVAFQAENLGRESHQLLLLQLDVALGTEESIGRIELLRPGRSWRLVLRGLEPGGYAFVCNLPDGRGVPHSSRGMRVEFQVR